MTSVEQWREQIRELWHPQFRESHDGYFTQLINDLMGQDPRSRSAALTKHLVVSQRWTQWLADQRDAAVREMEAGGSSYQEIAAALGVHKSRVQQIMERLHRHEA